MEDTPQIDPPRKCWCGQVAKTGPFCDDHRHEALERLRVRTNKTPTPTSYEEQRAKADLYYQ